MMEIINKHTEKLQAEFESRKRRIHRLLSEIENCKSPLKRLELDVELDLKLKKFEGVSRAFSEIWELRQNIKDAE